MTQTISPFRPHDPKQTRRSSRTSTGRVFYGSALRRLLDADPPESAHDRDAQMGWLLAVILVPVVILLAALIATL